MATVVFSSGLRRFTGGVERVSIAAGNIRELIAALEKRFPDLKESLGSMAVAIDDEIIQDPLLETLQPDSEVHFLPPIGGG